MKKIIIAVLTALALTDCAENKETPIVNASDIINSVFENSTASTETSRLFQEYMNS